MSEPAGAKSAPIPRTFLQYLGQMGPGIVVVLTWLGAGDIVDASVSGADFGYALMWVLAGALLIRWMFVANIARFELCNERGLTVMEALRELHPLFPPFIMFSTIALCHGVNVYMYVGLGDSCRELAKAAGLGDGGPSWLWSVGWSVAFYLLLSRPVFKRIEVVFLLFLGVLSVSLLTAAALARPNLAAILHGTFGFEMPAVGKAFDPKLVAVSLVGAVAGSIANLMYPYLMREKGWTTPAHRKVQLYDLALGIMVIIVLDLAVWAVGAEVLHPKGLRVEGTHDLAALLTETMGPIGGVLIYLGIFAAVGSSLVGNALGYGFMATHAYLLWRPVEGYHDAAAYRSHPGYRKMVLWGLFSPLPWVLSGQAQFVPLTVTLNAFQVFLLPVLAVGIWRLTAGTRFMGSTYRNNLLQNAGMAIFTLVALLGTLGAGESLLKSLLKLLNSSG
jgi:Mn2+/Fe2+ NRAMP family transporter